MFLLGAVVLLRTATPGADDGGLKEAEYGAQVGEDPQPKTFLRAVVASFLVLFATEWGDLSQLLTISLVGTYEDHISVFVGAWTALLAASGLAVIAGRVLLRWIRLSVLHYVGASVCLVLAALTLYEIVAA
ncbi:MAG: TMEM165/GDT1 family protein [Nocardioidaceae bacterium]|nr:TMEM165/GDT1 family protein [Nocardioidaceae bacterium]